jgi:hypothetical protein
MVVLILKSYWLSLDSILGFKLSQFSLSLRIEHHENLVGSIYQENNTQARQWDSIWFQFPTLMHNKKIKNNFE